MLKTCVVLLCLFSALSSEKSLAQEAKRKIIVECDCPDDIGVSYEALLRKRLSSSRTFDLIQRKYDINTPASIWVIHITSEIGDDLFTERPPDVLSIALTAGPIYLSHWTQNCGRAVIDVCAEKTTGQLAFWDKAASQK